MNFSLINFSQKDKRFFYIKNLINSFSKFLFKKIKKNFVKQKVFRIQFSVFILIECLLAIFSEYSLKLYKSVVGTLPF